MAHSTSGIGFGRFQDLVVEVAAEGVDPDEHDDAEEASAEYDPVDPEPAAVAGWFGKRLWIGYPALGRAGGKLFAVRRVMRVKVNPEKIGAVIGPRGKMIRAI